MERITTGIRKLDSLLGGGFPVNASVLLSGGPGTGKTIFGLNFLLEGARKGEKCCYVSLNETKDNIIRAAKGIHSLSDIDKYLGKNLAVEYIPLGQSNVTLHRFAETLNDYPSLDRIVIDNVNKLLMSADTQKSYRVYFSEILKQLRNMKSSMIICETAGDELDSGNMESFECDGVVQLSFLELEEKPSRSITVHKMRFTSFEPKVPHEMTISDKKIDIGEAKVI